MATRFAPSPSGYLHAGHLWSALAVWDAAERHALPVRLRIEDIDAARCDPRFAAAITEDLAWLCFTWSGAVETQQSRIGRYREVLDALTAKELAYPCGLSRRDIAAGARPAPGNAPASEAKGAPLAWRFDLRAAAKAASVPLGAVPWQQVDSDAAQEALRPGRPGAGDLSAALDPVLWRKDQPASYHLSCTADDHDAGITLVVRGTDLLEAAPVQSLLRAALGWPQPLHLHHGLVLGEDGAKLSKRHGAPALRRLREAGCAPEAVRRAARALGRTAAL